MFATPTVVATWVYPIKGMHGIETPTKGIRADPVKGVLGDRVFGLYRKPTDTPTEWKPKGQFHVCMNQEGMALPHNLTENDLGEDYQFDTDYVSGWLMGNQNIPSSYALTSSHGDWRMTDSNKPYVSFLNLASVRDLEEYFGITIDRRRFRMNVWVEGLKPWMELDWIKHYGDPERYLMTAGNCLLQVDDLCERCRAIEQDPTTGLFDSNRNLLDLIDNRLWCLNYEGSPHRNVRKVMGWLAIPQDREHIKIGDEVRTVTAHPNPR